MRCVVRWTLDAQDYICGTTSVRSAILRADARDMSRAVDANLLPRPSARTLPQSVVRRAVVSDESVALMTVGNGQYIVRGSCVCGNASSATLPSLALTLILGAQSLFGACSSFDNIIIGGALAAVVSPVLYACVGEFCFSLCFSTVHRGGIWRKRAAGIIIVCCVADATNETQGWRDE